MRILITRPEPELSRFAAELRERGIESVAAPMMRIEPAETQLPALDGVQALVFTSANGVRAYAALGGRKDLPVYAVGDATAAAARAEGFADVASADGDWKALAALIANELDPAKGALLHLAGEDRAGDLPGVLGARGFAFTQAVVYRAVPVTALPEAARSALAGETVDGVALFSPRSAGIFAALVAEAGVAEAGVAEAGVANAGLQGKLGALQAFCLSQAVADALPDKAAWRAVYVAERPNAEALLNLIRAHQHTPDTRPPQSRQEERRSMNEERAAYTGNDAERIIAAFGGIRPMAKALGIAVTTVQGWKERGAIPLKRMDDIRASAARAGIDLEAALAAPAASVHDPQRAEKLDMGRDVEPEPVSAERIAAGPEPGLRAAESAPPPPPSFDAPRATPPAPPRWRWAYWGAGFGAAFVAGGVLAMALGLGGSSAADGQRQALDRLQARLNALTSQLEDQQKRQQGEAANLQTRVNRIEAVERAIGEQRERLAGIAASAAALASRLERVDMDVKGLAARGPAAPDDVKELRTQIEALAKRLDAAPASAGDAAQLGAQLSAQLKELADRLAAVERRAGELAQTRPGADGDLKAAFERQTAENKAALDRLVGDARAAAERLAGESAALRKDLAALQGRVSGLAQDVEKGVAGTGAAPLVVAVGQLRRAVADGTPYRPALDAVGALAKNRADMAPALDALRARAENGVATLAQLRGRFDKMSLAVLRAHAAPGADADFWDRVWSRVQSLVTVRRVGDVAGETVAAQVARAENALSRADLAEAVKQLSGLAGPAKEAAAGWLADARARLDAEAALAKLDSAALDMLRSPEPKARP